MCVGQERMQALFNEFLVLLIIRRGFSVEDNVVFRLEHPSPDKLSLNCILVTLTFDCG